MKTLSDVLHDADPADSESRSPQARAMTRGVVMSGPQHHHYETHPVSRRRVVALAGALGAACIAVGVFGWRTASVDVAAMRFEARLAGSQDAIVDTHDILTAQVVPGSEPSTFWVSVTLTDEGGEKMRQATESHIGEHLEMIVDGKLVISPTIRSAISSTAMLSGDYTWEQASRIVEGLLKGKLELRNDK